MMFKCSVLKYFVLVAEDETWHDLCLFVLKHMKQQQIIQDAVFFKNCSKDNKIYHLKTILSVEFNNGKYINIVV